MKMLIHAAVDSEQSIETPYPESPWVVMKFGGRSVSTAENWGIIADLIRQRMTEGVTPFIVHSALAGISNALIALLDLAVQRGDTDSALADIRSKHDDLATALGIDGSMLDEHFERLGQLIAGIRLVGEVSPRVHARVLATGELAATTLGAAYLSRQSLPAQWLDARHILQSTGKRNETERARYLSATCDFAADPALQDMIRGMDGFVLTQGFIGRNAQRETVLLGRGGSDTSAAYFAGKLEARRLEIWTDVPGFFSADPRAVPSARLIRSLHYREAQEIASAGGGILHPRSISPVRRSGIPLYLKCTMRPDWQGSVVSNASEDEIPRIKAVSHRRGITLIVMESMEMWHEVGFLAEAFDCFREHGISVDLISTSESNVTVSVDTAANVADRAAIEDLAADLRRLCRVNVIEDCAAVTLVGRRIRTILPELGPALQVFQEQKVYLVTQAANDLNLTFVVEAEHAHRLVQDLHRLLVNKLESGAFGPTWEQLSQPSPGFRQAPVWWRSKRSLLLEIAAHRKAAYVYDRETIAEAVRTLRGLATIDRVLYAMKANPHPEVLKVVDDQGADFECVSPGEIQRVLTVFPDIDRRRILFTPNFAPRDEYAWSFEQGVHVTLDNLHPLRHWPELFRRREIFVRIDTGHGHGHHEHVRTAGAHSKFGIPLFEIDELQDLVQKAEARIVGLHAHVGSGVLEANGWRTTAEKLLELRERFAEVRYLDLGGGLGIPERPGERPLDLAQLDASLEDVKTACGDCEVWLEPGRYIVARAGVLLATVTQLKGKGDVQYVGVATGMNSLIRPALYGAYHEIVNLTRLDEPASDVVTIVGPNCESGDRLGSDRLLPSCREGDILLIANTGAYGHAMSSHYNLRPPAEEIAI